MMKRPGVAYSGAAPLPPESVPHFTGIRNRGGEDVQSLLARDLIEKIERHLAS
jgi:hypothetical protein